MPAPKVVQVIPHARLGGMQQVARDLNSGLPSHGIDSSLINLAEWTAGSGPRVIRRIRGWFRLVSHFRHGRPDSVLAHTVLNALYSLTAARLAGVRDRWLVLHIGRSAMGRLRVAVIRLLGISTVATGLICCGYTVRDSYLGLGRAVGRRMHVVQNGVRLPEQHVPGQLPGSGADLTLVAACRLDPVKDLPTAIRACARVRARVHLTICGDGPLRAELESLSRELDAPVDFAGKLDRPALAARFAACEVFLLTTKHEGLPLVLIEAAAAGLPVIASDIPANREVMGDAALYCPVGDVEAFAAAIDLLASDAQRRSELQSSGWERVHRFSVDRMVGGYAALLRRA